MDEAFAQLAALFQRRIYLVIDALDECMDREAEGLLTTMQTWIKDTSMSLKIAVLSRNEPDLIQQLSKEARIKVEDHDGEDIRAHTDLRLELVTGLSKAERFKARKAVVQHAEDKSVSLPSSSIRPLHQSNF